MTIVGIAILLLLAGITLALILLPLLRPEASATPDTRQRERILDYYERVLSNVRDLDEDERTGKIHPQEYHYEREQWLQRGTRLLAMLDALDTQGTLITAQGADEAQIDQAIEQRVHRTQPSPRDEA